jgi:hypothetical protein
MQSCVAQQVPAHLNSLAITFACAFANYLPTGTLYIVQYSPTWATVTWTLLSDGGSGVKPTYRRSFGFAVAAGRAYVFGGYSDRTGAKRGQTCLIAAKIGSRAITK